MTVQEERMHILRMLEEGKITADQAAALLEALGDEGSRTPGGAREHAGAGAKASTAARELGAKGQELASQVREAIRAAMRSVPHVADELRENWHEVRHDIQQALREIKREIKEELGRGPLVDMSGLAELFQNLRGVTKWPAHESEEVLTGELSGEAPRVRLTTKNGSISMRGWEEPGYKVVLKKRVYVEDESEAQELARSAVSAAASSDSLEVAVHESSKISVSIEAWLPKDRRLALEATSQNGAVALEGVDLLEGSLSTTNGAVRVKEASARRLRLNTVNGAISADESSVESLEASTTNGGVIWSGGAKEAKLSSVNGGLRVEAGFPGSWGPVAATRYKLECVNGSMRIAVPGDPAVGVKLEARGRRIDLGGAEDAFELERESGGGPGSSRRMTGATRGFESAPKQVFIEATTLNGTVRVEREAKSKADEGGEADGEDGRTSGSDEA